MSDTQINKVKLSITLSPAVLEALNEFAAQKGVSRSAVIALALDKFMKEGA